MSKRSIVRCCLLGMAIYLLSAGGSMAAARHTEDMTSEDRNEILVTFQENVSGRKAQQVIEKADGTVEEALPSLDSETLVVSLETTKEQAAAMRSLEQSPEVESVQPNYV